MDRRVKWLLVVGVVVFFGWVVWGSVARVGAECSLCIQFNGRNICRSGAGATVEEARRAATESACGGNAQGMSENIACTNTPPTRVQCSTR